MLENKKIFVAGHNGMVGSAIIRELEKRGPQSIIKRSSAELDLTNQAAVVEFFQNEEIDYVILAAAKVGGIHANNTYPADFIYQNLMIEANVIHSAYLAGVDRLLFLGSSCIYPKHAQQPMQEDALLTGKLEETNEPYAIAKIAGIKLCESYNRQYGTDYRSVMPTNLYGPGDNFHPENSHVIPALIQRFHKAKFEEKESIVIWGTGIPKREFLYVDDMAYACLHVLGLDKKLYSDTTEPMLSHINVGSGIDISIANLSHLISDVVGYKGKIVFDANMPDGTPRKLLDVNRLKKLGVEYRKSLKDGLTDTYYWYLNNYVRSK